VGGSDILGWEVDAKISSFLFVGNHPAGIRCHGAGILVAVTGLLWNFFERNFLGESNPNMTCPLNKKPP